MKKNVVFYGAENQGKSTLLGYIVVDALHINVDAYEQNFLMRTASLPMYDSALFYRWMVNREDIYIPVDCINDLTGDMERRYEFNRSGRSINISQRGLDFDIGGKNVTVNFYDTPGHTAYVANRDVALNIGDVGVFCVEISEVLKKSTNDLFNADYINKYNVWPIFKGKKPIIVLTKIDLNGHLNEADYIEACKKVKEVTGYGDDTIIVPTYVSGKDKKGANVSFVDKSITPWYSGMCLIDAIKSELQK